MSEIVCIHIGGSGVKVGLKFWQKIEESKKQGEKHNPDAHYSILYHETQKQGQKPRAIFLDTDIRSNYLVSGSDINFDRSLIHAYGSSCNNLFSEGYYGEGWDMKGPMEELMRKQVQKCDNMSGFIVTRSPMGGAGSGLASHVFQTARNQHSCKILEQFRIMPGFNESHQNYGLNQLQIYNSILSNNKAHYNVDVVYLFENTKIEMLLQKRKIGRYTFDDINSYIAQCMDRHVKAYIEPDSLRTSQRKRTLNLCCHLGRRHISGSLGYTQEGEDHFKTALNLQNRVIQVNSKENNLISSMHIDLNDTAITQYKVSQIVKAWDNQPSSSKFYKWVSHPIHLSYSRQSNVKKDKSTWILFDGSENIQWAKKLREMYRKCSKKQRYFHHYNQLTSGDFKMFWDCFTDFVGGYECNDEKFKEQSLKDEEGEEEQSSQNN